MSRSVDTFERTLASTRWRIASMFLIVPGCFNPDREEVAGDATETSSTTDARTTDETGGTNPSSSTSTDSSSASTSGETTWTSSPDDSTGDDEGCNPLDPACPEGEKCQPFADGSAACTSAPNSGGAAGDECTIDGDTEIDDCQPGLFCWGASQSGSGTCVTLCGENGPDCTEPWLGCGPPWYDAKIGLCLPMCDPLAQDCAEGAGCYGDGGNFLCYPSAQQGGAYASACTQVNECSPGLQCVQPAAVPGCVAPVGCCTPYCDLTSPDGDQQCQGYAAGQACVPYYQRGQAPPGYQEVGICLIP